MATRKIILKFDMELETEQREGYFATRAMPFAITAYGDTDEKAEQRAIQAAFLLLDQYSATPSKMSDFLNHRGVKHVIHEEVKGVRQRPPVVRSCRKEMRVEVLAGG